MREQSRGAAVAQSVERRIGSAEVTGSIPVSSSEEQDCEKGGNYCIINVSAFFYGLKYNRDFFNCAVLVKWGFYFAIQFCMHLFEYFYFYHKQIVNLFLPVSYSL